MARKTGHSKRSKAKGLTYADAGVHFATHEKLVGEIFKRIRGTYSPRVMEVENGFGGLFSLDHDTALFKRNYRRPVLVACTDGVGTKLKLAFELGKHDTVGIDCVAMSINDMLCMGAEPLFFLDYIATGKKDLDVMLPLVSGVAEGCKQSGCTLLGGETAEMPDFYPEGEYDIAGFAVGVVDKNKIIRGDGISPGDVVLGIESSGLHSNGFSLVRKCLERAAGQLPATLDGQPFRQAVMAPTRIYVKSVLAALAAHPNSADAASHGGIKALAHITGGGLLENIPRVLPGHLAAHLVKGSWPQTELFAWLQRTAGIDDIEMNRTFNNGIGMVLVLAPAEAAACAATLRAAGEAVVEIGRIAPRGDGAAVTVG